MEFSMALPVTLADIIGSFYLKKAEVIKESRATNSFILCWQCWPC